MKQQEYIAVRANGRYSIPALGNALDFITDRGGSVIELMQAMVTMADAAAYYKAAHDAETDETGSVSYTRLPYCAESVTETM